MIDDNHTLRCGNLSATVKNHGAELCSLTDGITEFIWQAGPEWPRHAPLLFPVVGRLGNDELKHAGKIYRMTQHGFARDSRFAWVDRDAHRCVLVLEDDDTTRARYPFRFRLTATYALDQAGLDLTLVIANIGEETLPASIGGHPAFNWPLAPGHAKESYALTFGHAEPSAIRRLDGGLLRETPEPSPVKGTILPLAEHLFTDDAIVFDRIASRDVRYAASSGPWLSMSWRGFRELGVWSKPSGAAFVCIEPWRGYASPVAFDGDFSDKPGLMHIAPGAEETVSYRIEVGSS